MEDESEDEEDIQETSSKVRLWRGVREASMFVFPYDIVGDGDMCDDYMLGTKAVNKYITVDNKCSYVFTKDFKKMLENSEDLRKFSSKFATVIESINENEGNTFIYTEYKTIGSNLLGACINHLLEYEQYGDKISAFKNIGQQQVKEASACVKKDEIQKRQITIRPGNRYAILSGDTPQQVVRNILDLFNSDENIDGKYLKVIIATRVAREGINLANVQHIHILDPSWNQSAMYQALYRAIRATSHVGLIKKRQKELNDPKARVAVNIYRHATVYDVDEDGEYTEFTREVAAKKRVKLESTIDVKMYQLSEYKDRKIGMVMRMIKETAIDCQINYNRNYRDTDKDFSSDCNYLSCVYKCFDSAPDRIDYSTYDVYYLNEIIKIVVERIKNLFAVEDSYYLQDILSNISDIPQKFVLEGLGEIIRKRINLDNRYGFNCILQEDGNIYFLISETDFYSNIKNNLLISKYTSDLYAVENRNLEITTNIVRTELNESKAEALLENKEDLMENIKDITDSSILMSLIEQTLKKKTLSIEEKKIIDLYKNFIFRFPEPVSIIDATISKYTGKRTGRGRHPDPNKETKIARLKDLPPLNEQLEKDINNEEVIVHIMKLLRKDITGYKVSSDYFKAGTDIRIYKQSEDKWRDVTQYEKIAYNQLIQTAIKESFENFAEGKNYFGTVMPDGVFRIVDKTKEDVKADKNLHHAKRGSTCKNLNLEVIYLLLSSLEIQPNREIYKNLPHIPQSDSELRTAKKTLQDHSIETKDLSNKQIAIIYLWIKTNLNKDAICTYIYKYLEDNDLLYKVL